MNEPIDVLEKKVRAAAGAGWWVVVIAIIVAVIQWFAYLHIMHVKPAWVLCAWGPNLDWAFVQNVMFWAMGILKLLIAMMILASLWLTLWARRLRKLARL